MASTDTSAKKEVELADDDPRIWGWHSDGSGSSARIAGILVALSLFALTLGNHEGRVEALWMAGMGIIILIMVAISFSNRRKSTWRK